MLRGDFAIYVPKDAVLLAWQAFSDPYSSLIDQLKTRYYDRGHAASRHTGGRIIFLMGEG